MFIELKGRNTIRTLREIGTRVWKVIRNPGRTFSPHFSLPVCLSYFSYFLSFIMWKVNSLAHYPKCTLPISMLTAWKHVDWDCKPMKWAYFEVSIFKLQASETLRNRTHSNTAADLLQAKQQLEEQDHLLEDYQKKKEDFKMQINSLQEKIKVYEMVCVS